MTSHLIYNAADPLALRQHRTTNRPRRRHGIGAGDARLPWGPPPLVNPITVTITTTNPIVTLNNNRDYIISLGNTPVAAGIRIQGGHNIEVIGGEIKVPQSQLGVAGIYLRDQAPGSQVLIEGVELTGPGMSDGLGVEEPNPRTTVDLENIRVESLHSPNEKTWDVQHPDLIQTDTGPTDLNVCGFTGYTPYQGFFLAPNDPHYGGRHNPTRAVNLKNIDLHHRRNMAHNASVMLWQSTPFAMTLNNVWIDPGTPAHNPTLWPDAVPWVGVHFGDPPVSFVPAGSVGIGYRSPGYTD